MTHLSPLDIFADKNKKKEAVSQDVTLPDMGDKTHVAMATSVILHLTSTLTVVKTDNNGVSNHAPTSKGLSSPFNVFRNLHALEDLENQMKKSRSSVASTAINAASPKGAKSSAKKASHSTGSNSVGAANDVPDFPTNNPNYPSPPFDPNDVPTSENDIRQRFNDWLNAIRSSSNPNTLFAFLEWMTNLQKAMGNTPFVKDLFNKLASITSSDGKSFAEMIVEALRASWYYTGNYDVAEEMQKLAQMFQGLAGDNDLFKAISFYATNDSRGIDEWIQQQKDNPIADDDFFYYEFGQIYNWFHSNQDLSKQLHQWFMKQIDRLIKRFKHNPALLMTIIFTTIGGSMNNMQYQFGGYGTLNKRLEDISKKLADIQQKFADISDGKDIDPDELKKMSEEMKHLQYAVKQLKRMFGDSIFSTTNDALDKIFDAQTGDGQTLRDLVNSKDPDWTAAAKYLKDHNIFNKPGSTEPGKEDPGGPQELTLEIQQALRTASTAYTSQSQTISVQMKTISEQIQSIESQLKSITEDYSKWLTRLVQNQIQP